MVKMSYCPSGHSSEDFVHSDRRNSIFSWGRCSLCTKEHFIQEFKTWSSGNINIDKIIQESQTGNINRKLQWIPYDKFQNIKHIADGERGSVYSAEIENGIKCEWNFIKQDWRYDLIGVGAVLKEIKESRYSIAEFFKMIMTINDYLSEFIAFYYGISKNPSTQNYIIVMELFSENLHESLAKTFWDLRWKEKIDILNSIVSGLEILHTENLVHCDFHGGSILNCDLILTIDLDSCKLENDLILNANNKNNKIYGSIPYIPPEALRGNEFTRKGDIYSFGGIMYEMVTAQQPFGDQVHDTYLMIDICNGVRPKVPDFMLNWIPEWYLNLMYRCWSDDPSERPTAAELVDLFSAVDDNAVDNNIAQQLKIADENQKNTSKSQKQELFELFSHSSKLHPQSCYIGRYIHTLHGLHDLMEEIKSGKSSDPNLLKPNESIILKSNSYDTVLNS
ncbi:hypothetical protein Glove_84g59 [Diversispora epigaea]|uniref:Protein kinase domain-containing protein n=1 Tax=Diversispora epigaea TaxID=1348612 RepID=A0A397JGU6_9GLOM|nr:hypothetical protein Glove_84g59 [Diversispora epigaea]